ncbi:MAG: methyl-accepting chemotaxis protein [Deltaproteobacteria bacterium]|nr:methyl-accepting chemotaxis protein [Deltaproteobacteria bacterium]
MSKRPYKRRQYIVDPEFQYAFIRKVSLLAVLMVVMSLSFLALVYYLYGDIRIEIVQPDPFASTDSLKVMKETRGLLDLLWPVLALCLLATLAVTFFFGVLVSHRMAGPIFRIRRVLREMAAGDLRGEVRLRKKDSFKNLAAEISELKKTLRGRIQEMEHLLEALDPLEEPRQQEAIREIRALLSGFQVQ